jgi:hypothetical protein
MHGVNISEENISVYRDGSRIASWDTKQLEEDPTMMVEIIYYISIYYKKEGHLNNIIKEPTKNEKNKSLYVGDKHGVIENGITVCPDFLCITSKGREVFHWDCEMWENDLQKMRKICNAVCEFYENKDRLIRELWGSKEEWKKQIDSPLM